MVELLAVPEQVRFSLEISDICHKRPSFSTRCRLVLGRERTPGRIFGVEQFDCPGGLTFWPGAPVNEQPAGGSAQEQTQRQKAKTNHVAAKALKARDVKQLDAQAAQQDAGDTPRQRAQYDPTNGYKPNIHRLDQYAPNSCNLSSLRPK